VQEVRRWGVEEVVVEVVWETVVVVHRKNGI
jgi:hypothetical protein